MTYRSSALRITSDSVSSRDAATARAASQREASTRTVRIGVCSGIDRHHRVGVHVRPVVVRANDDDAVTEGHLADLGNEPKLVLDPNVLSCFDGACLDLHVYTVTRSVYTRKHFRQLFSAAKP
jgi:Fe-S cluster assembly iron-binding protein IscA